MAGSEATCEAGEFFHVLAEQAAHVQAKGVKFFLGLLLTGQGIELHNLANTQRNREQRLRQIFTYPVGQLWMRTSDPKNTSKDLTISLIRNM